MQHAVVVILKVCGQISQQKEQKIRNSCIKVDSFQIMNIFVNTDGHMELQRDLGMFKTRN